MKSNLSDVFKRHLSSTKDTLWFIGPNMSLKI